MLLSLKLDFLKAFGPIIELYMSPEVMTERQRGLEGLQTLQHPQFGYQAAIGRLAADYFRDLAATIKLVCSRTSNLSIPGFLQNAERALDLAALLQGKKFDPETEEAPGGIFHEFRNGQTPRERMEKLKAGDWPVREKPNGDLELVYYGAIETTSRFVSSVATIARAKAIVSSENQRDDYIDKMRPYVKAAFQHDIRIADTSGYGLLDSTPQNLHALFNQTEKDSDHSYITEEGDTPKPPYLFLSGNCYYLEELRDTAWMAKLMDEKDLEQEAAERYKKGVRQLHRLFWMWQEQYFTPLIDGEGQQVKIRNDDSIDGLWCGVFEQPYAEVVISFLMQPRMNTSYGIRSRSSDSAQFRVNEPRAYWNGTVWTHRQAMAAIGFENYGHFQEAEIIDGELMSLVRAKGCVELVAVTPDGELQDYTERGKKVAGNPQLWAVGAVLARTAEQLSLAA